MRSSVTAVLLLLIAIVLLLSSCAYGSSESFDKHVFDQIIAANEGNNESQIAQNEEIYEEDRSDYADDESQSFEQSSEIALSLFLVSVDGQVLALSELIDLLTEIQSVPSIAVFYRIDERYRTYVEYNIGKLISLNADIAVYVDSSSFLCEPSNMAFLEERGEVVLDVTEISGKERFTLTLTLDGEGGLDKECQVYTPSEEIPLLEYKQRLSENGSLLWETAVFGSN